MSTDFLSASLLALLGWFWPCLGRVMTPARRGPRRALHYLMPDEVTALRKVADAAKHVRTLERELVNNKDPRLVMDRLKVARLELDEALGDLERLGRG